jgi:hypothetical protein
VLSVAGGLPASTLRESVTNIIGVLAVASLVIMKQIVRNASRNVEWFVLKMKRHLTASANTLHWCMPSPDLMNHAPVTNGLETCLLFCQLRTLKNRVDVPSLVEMEACCGSIPWDLHAKGSQESEGR